MRMSTGKEATRKIAVTIRCLRDLGAGEHREREWDEEKIV